MTSHASSPVFELKGLIPGQAFAFRACQTQFTYEIIGSDEEYGMPVARITAEGTDEGGVEIASKLADAELRVVLLGTVDLCTDEFVDGGDGAIVAGHGVPWLKVMMVDEYHFAEIDEGGDRVFSVFPLPDTAPELIR